jgi:hypothetical protein
LPRPTASIFGLLKSFDGAQGRHQTGEVRNNT